MEISLAMIVIAALIAIYYGMGRNLEVGSRMVTRELEDAERLQKERIVRKYSSRNTKDDMSDANYKKAVAHITKIDDLDI